MNEERLRRFLTLSLALFMGASLFYVCFRYVLPWCLPFLLALLVAALLEPVVLYLRRKFHFQRGFSALILTLTLLFLLGGLLSLLWSTLLSQTNALLAAAPAFFDAIPAAADDNDIFFHFPYPLWFYNVICFHHCLRDHVHIGHRTNRQFFGQSVMVQTCSTGHDLHALRLHAL